MKLTTDRENAYEADPMLSHAIDNNREVLDEVFARHRRQLYSRALRVLRSPEDAEDALQEGLLSAFRNLHRFKGRSKLSTWLTRIVVNAALMQLRQRRSRVMVSMDDRPTEDGQEWANDISDPRFNPEEACTLREQRRILRRGIQKLAMQYRRALWLRDIRGLTTREAAEVLGVSVGTLKSQLSRARLRVKEEIVAEPTQTLIREKLSNRGSVRTTGHSARPQFSERLLPAA